MPPSVGADYLAAHGIAPEVAEAVGVRVEGDAILYPYRDEDGEYVRRRDLSNGGTYQPRGRPLTLWWPTRRDGRAILLAEGESDALAAGSAIAATGDDFPAALDEIVIAAVPGVGMPRDRVAEELRDAGAEIVYLALDGDEPGRRAAAGIAESLAEVGITALLVALPDGQDLSDALVGAEDRPRALAPLLETACPAGEGGQGGDGGDGDGPPGESPDVEPPTAGAPKHQPGTRLTSFAGIEPEKVEWLWPSRVPLGMLTLLVGDPGLGRSLLTCHLAAKVSRAGFAVVLSTAEDHAAATVRPRLDAADADLSRVHLADCVDGDGLPRTLELPGDVDPLAAKVKEVGARLLVIDPFTAHLPEAINSWKDQGVRRALAPLHRLAEEHGCAVIVVAHLNKATGADPLYRTGGSIAIPAAVRSALLLARDPDDPEGERGSCRVLAHHKCNVGPLAESLTYRIEPAGETACLRPTGQSEARASDLLLTPSGEERTERDEAEDFLRAELTDGPRPTKEIKSAAADAGLSWRTVERAKAALRIEVERVGEPGKRGGGRWTWGLPVNAATSTPPPLYPPSGGLNRNGSRKPSSEASSVNTATRGDIGSGTPTEATEADEAEIERIAAKLGMGV